MFETDDAVTTVAAQPVLTVRTKELGETSEALLYVTPFTVTDVIATLYVPARLA